MVTSRADWVADAPLLQAWYQGQDRLAAGRFRPFTVPGHKQRTELPGDVVAGDLPLYGGLAPIRDADALLADAERRAADFYGTDWCAFSVGGATHGNQALALAVGRPGDEVVVSRTLHRSMLLGLVLAGLVPVWVRPRLDEETGLPTAIEPDAVRAALAAHPGACAVMVTDPSYVGVCGDLPGLAAVAHDGGVPLVVDAAWGAHFGLHPDLPTHPLAAGADAVVTSAHKSLLAANQGAYVLAHTRAAGGLLDGARLRRALEASRTTSPSGMILASLDGSRALLAARGEELAGALVELVADARTALAMPGGPSHVPGLACWTGPAGPARRVGPDAPAPSRFDPAKLVLLLAGTGAHGRAVGDDLDAAGVPVEMADRDLLVPMVTMADDAQSLAALLEALGTSLRRHYGPAREPSPHPAWTVEPEQVVSPREAFFADTERVAWAQAAGRVCAEVIAPYPPGVPVLAPGERIAEEALTALSQAKADGARIAYAADETLATIEVLRVAPTA